MKPVRMEDKPENKKMDLVNTVIIVLNGRDALPNTILKRPKKTRNQDILDIPIFFK